MVRPFSKTTGGIGPSTGGRTGVAKRPYLPGAPIFAGGTIRLISGYSGKAIQVARDSDNTTQDINFIGDVLDTASLWSFIGNSGGQCSITYDQSGGANHAVHSATPANRPRIAPRAQTQNLIAGNVTIRPNWEYLTDTQPRPIKMAAIVWGNNQSLSVFISSRPQSSNYAGALLEIGGNAISPANFNLYLDGVSGADGDTNWGFKGIGSTAANTGILPRCQPTVVGMVGSASATKIWRDGAVTSYGAPPSTSQTGGLMYSSSVTGFQQPGGDVLGWVVYNTTLSDVDSKTVTQALMPSIIRGTDLECDDGDSIMQGIKTTYGMNLLLQGESGLNHAGDHYNIALSGQYLTNITTRFATRGALLYDATKRMNKYVIWAGSNDMVAGGFTAAQVYASVTTLLAAAKTAGYQKTVIGTVLPRGDATIGEQTIISAYNVLVRGNTAGADAIMDVAGDATMGLQATTANTTYYNADTIHPTLAGYTLLYPYYVAAINSLA